MRATVTISVQRDDGVQVSKTVGVETERIYQGGGFRRETKAETRKRFDRHLTAAVNSTLGR